MSLLVRTLPGLAVLLRPSPATRSRLRSGRRRTRSARPSACRAVPIAATISPGTAGTPGTSDRNGFPTTPPSLAIRRGTPIWSVPLCRPNGFPCNRIEYYNISSRAPPDRYYAISYCQRLIHITLYQHLSTIYYINFHRPIPVYRNFRMNRPRKSNIISN